LADSYSLVYFILALSVSTHFSDIQGYTNTVINPILLYISYIQVFHYIEPDLKKLSDHIPLIVNLSIISENISVYRMVLEHNSKEKVVFLLFISKKLSQLNFYTLDSVTSLNSLSKIISKLFSDY